MSEEYEVLKAQKDELEKRHIDNYSRSIGQIEGMDRERDRIRAAVEEALETTERVITTTKDIYFYGYRDGFKAMLVFLKDGEADGN